MITDLKLYKVDMKYIRNLHNIDDKVLSVSPQTGKDSRVFVGIVIVCGTHKYCIPLSSPKAKHKKMKNAMDFSKIEIDGKLLGVLNFNLMIPVEEEQLQLVDTTIFKRDRDNIRVYKKLCWKELEWCRSNSEIICNKANVLYKKYISDENFSGKERCLNFPKLEDECKKYNAKKSRGSYY
jgi:protein AbiQ